MTPKKIKLAIVVSHPIQHFVPFYRMLADDAELELKVFFMADFSLRRYFDREMSILIAWNMDLLSGYEHEFLPEAKRIDRSSPLTLNNPSITKRLAAFGPDVVLAYGYNQVTQIRTLTWCRKRGLPILMTSDSELNQTRAGWRRATKAKVLPVLLRQYSAFLTTGDNNECYLRSYGVPDAKLFRSPFTIDEVTYVHARKQRQQMSREFRSRHAIGSDEMVLLTVGKLSARKRPFDVIVAARHLMKKAASRPLRFLIAGNGALMAEIKATVASEHLPVICLGFVNVDMLPQVYAASDAVLHLAEADPHPLVLSEAACIGLPLIVSDKVGAIGPTDIARDGENTIVTPCGDSQAIADAIARLIEDPGLTAHMSEASVRIFSELDMRRSVDGLKAAVRYAIARPTANPPSAEAS